MTDYEKIEKEFNEVINFINFLSNEADKTQVKTKKRKVKKCEDSPIEDVIFNQPATIVLWKDGTKTIVKCQRGDFYNKETGLALCICKKLMGRDFHTEFDRWVK